MIRNMFGVEAAAGSQMISSFFLSLIFLYMALTEKQRCINFWLFGVILLLIRYSFRLCLSLFPQLTFFYFAVGISSLGAFFLLTYGLFVFSEKKIPLFIYAFLLFSVISLFAFYSHFPEPVLTFPGLIGEALFLTVCGILLISTNTNIKTINFYLGILFLVSALIKVFFLFERDISPLFMLFAMIAMMLEMLSLFGLVLLYLTKSRDLLRWNYHSFIGRSEESRYLLENQSDCILRLDSQGKILFANDCVKQLTGTTDIKNKSFSEFLHPDCLNSFFRVLDSLAYPPHYMVHTEQVRARDGWHWYSWSSRAVLDKRGKVRTILAIGRDTTEQLKRNESVRAALDLSFWGMDAADNDLIRLFLHKSCLLTESGQATLIIPDDEKIEFIKYSYDSEGDMLMKENHSMSALGPHWDDALLCRVPVMNEKEAGGKSSLIVPVHEGDRVAALVGVESKEIPYQDFDKDNLALVGQTMINLLLKKKAEDTKTTREKRLLDFFSHSPIGLFILDRNFCFIDGNEKFLATLGASHDFLSGKSLDLISPEAAKLWRPYLIQLRESEVEILDTESALFNKTKDKIDIFSVSFYPLFDSDNCLNGIAGVLLNISPRKKAEHERDEIEKQLHFAQKKEALGTLAGGVAHDFNNILGGIRGYAEMAMERVEDNISGKMLNQILTGIDRAGELVNRILSFSKQREIRKEALNMLDIAHEVKNLINPSLPSRARLRIEAEEEQYVIEADSTQMHQVLMNLCTNAMHSLQGSEGGVITVRLSHQIVSPDHSFPGTAVPGAYILVEVEDNGCGMTPELIEKIFDPYFTTRGAGKGSGLGLSVAQGIIRNHNGSLELESREGEGTLFRIYFPALIEQNIPHRLEKESIMRGGDEDILLIDDDTAFLLMFETMLQSLGYTVYSFVSGKEALLFLEEDPGRVDCVISDYSMPDINGEELAEQIRLVNSELPIILCSGYAEGLNEEKIDRTHISFFMHKPFSKKELSDNVRAAIDSDKKDLPLES